MDIDDDDIPSSPTNSSPSSSDLDTESTGSFFLDRSTTLGTLMGVTLNNSSSFRSIRPHPVPVSTTQQSTTPASHRRRRRGRRRARSGWWRLCRGDTVVPTKLGDFLEVERRISNAGVLIEAEIYYGDVSMPREEGRLFENGRVLPPPPVNRTKVERRKKVAEAPSLVWLAGCRC